jgi:glyoxylase-like metal-dependent hydrolase (beta-lactamase superfamily II)
MGRVLQGRDALDERELSVRDASSCPAPTPTISGVPYERFKMMTELPVAAEWFRITRIDDAITRIEEPYADPWVSANSWHVRGKDRDLLIDTGLGVASLRQCVSEFADHEPVAVVTHAHLDHMGSAHEFTECWAHELEPTQARGQGTLFGQRLLEILGAEDVEFEPPGAVLVSAVPRRDFELSAYELRPVVPTRRLVDGDLIDLGDRTLEVLHLPGHTPGSVGLLDTANRILFTGDVIYDPLAILDDLIGSNADDYARSMGRLLEVDVDCVHTGHGESFDGARLRELVAEYLRHRRPPG